MSLSLVLSDIPSWFDSVYISLAKYHKSDAGFSSLLPIRWYTDFNLSWYSNVSFHSLRWYMDLHFQVTLLNSVINKYLGGQFLKLDTLQKLSIYSFIRMDYGFLFYSVSYNLLVSYLFGAILSKIWHWELLEDDSCSLFDMTLLFLEHFSISQDNRMFQTHLYFPVPALEIDISLGAQILPISGWWCSKPRSEATYAHCFFIFKLVSGLLRGES